MKRIRYTEKDGFGAVALVAVIAIVVIGGVIIYEVSTKDNAIVPVDQNARPGEADRTSQPTATMRAEALASLRALKERTLDLMEDLRSQVSAEGNVEVSTDVFADIKADISEMYANADSEARTELNKLRAQIAQVEARITSDDADAKGKMSEALKSITADIKATLGIGASAQTATSSNATSSPLQMR